MASTGLWRTSTRLRPVGSAGRVASSCTLQVLLELQVAGGVEGRITITDVQVTPEAMPINSELQGAGDDEGRITGLQVTVKFTSKVLLMNSELQGAGGDEGRITGLQVTDLQVTSEVLLVDELGVASCCWRRSCWR